MTAGCEWKVHALTMKDEYSFQVRQYHFKHNCGPVCSCKNVNSTWLSKRFEQEFRADPKRNIKGSKSDVVRDIRCHVSQSQAYRAKWKALKKIEGNPDDQYKQLWDYAGELQKTNPGSTVYEHSIKPMNGPELWEKIGYIPPLPPKFRKGVGRPKKLRRREVDEPAQKQKKKSRDMKKGSRIERQQKIVKCKGCGLCKHNIKTCYRVLRDEADPPFNPVPDEQPPVPAAEDRVETVEDIYSELLQFECLDDVMIGAPDSAVEYGEKEPSTNAPTKLQVKKKRKTTSPPTLEIDVKNKISNKNGLEPPPTLETCIGEDHFPKMLKQDLRQEWFQDCHFAPTPSLPPRPTLSPFMPPRTAPPQSLPPPPFVPPRTPPPQLMPPLPLPAPTSQAVASQKGVNIRASPHFSHRVCLQPKINKDRIEKSSSSFIMKDGKKYVTLYNLNKVIVTKEKRRKIARRRFLCLETSVYFVFC
ncbi:UNVERIFIED_CONTAM: hypothetical protein Slati_3120400 [Sesamum latifolium]|uniref:Transposase MuDR plant domain-containing protein n=1 Tax=Sesamum latifolium TaxID=2727402 RepID=A0AAW2UXI0_9LAMI